MQTLQHRLAQLLQAWHSQLQQWALEGALGAAAQNALQLSERPPALEQLIASLVSSDAQALPPVQLLQASAMPGAAGAYAASTDTIYLNADWLASASDSQAITVLTEELGHYLDALLNPADTAGDEGELFAALLTEQELNPTIQQRLASENDALWIEIEGETTLAEASTAPGIDTEAPLLLGFQLDATLLDPSLPGGAFLSGNLTFADGGSGFTRAALTFSHASSGQQITLQTRGIATGSPREGTAFASSEVDQQAASGVWSLSQVELTDKAGNILSKQQEDSDWQAWLNLAGVRDRAFEVINSYPFPHDARITGLTLSSRSLDLSQNPDSQLSATLTFTDAHQAYRNIFLIFENSETQKSASLSFFEGRNISRTGGDGFATASFRDTAGLAAGQWKPVAVQITRNDYGSEFQFLDTSKIAAYYTSPLKSTYAANTVGSFLAKYSEPEWSDLLNRLGLGEASFNITNPNENTQPPQITGFSLSSTAIALPEDGGAFLHGTLNYVDNLSSLYEVTMRFRQEAGPEIVLLTFSSIRGRASGSSQAGSLIGSQELSTATIPGRYTLEAVQITDRAGYWLFREQSNEDWTLFLSEAGLGDASFEVLPSEATPVHSIDAEAPTILGFQLSRNIFDLASADQDFLSGSLRFGDNLSGLQDASLTFRNNISNQDITLRTTSNRPILEGSRRSGTAFLSQPFEPLTAAGLWSLSAVTISDQAGNRINKRNTNADWGIFLSSSGITDTSFQVINTPRDDQAPQISNLKLTASAPSPGESSNAYITGTLDFSDNLSGFSRANFTFRGNLGGGSAPTINLDFNQTFGSIQTGSSTSGTAKASTAIPSLAPGIWSEAWQLANVSWNDQDGNTFSDHDQSPTWSNTLASLIQAGSTTSFSIDSPITDTQLPRITGLSLSAATLDASQSERAVVSGLLSYTDDISGFSRATIDFVNSETGFNGFQLYFDSYEDRISGNRIHGSAFASATAGAGTYVIDAINFRDRAYNTIDKRSSDADWDVFLANSGLSQSSFTITAASPAVGTTGSITSSTPGNISEGSLLIAPAVTGDPDGDATEPNYSYQWYRNSVALEGATDPTYAVPIGAAGFYKVAITYSDATGNTDTVSSAYQRVSAIDTGLGNIGPLSADAPLQTGVTLTAPAVTGDPDGDAANPAYAYQWLLHSSAIAGATAANYTVPASGSGTYKVAITYTDAAGNTATIESPEQVVAPAPLPALSLSTSQPSQPEGNSGVTPYLFSVNRSGDLSTSSSVSWAVRGSGSDPADGSDFSGGGLPSGSLAFAAGETSKTITLQIQGDTTPEADEGFQLTLSSPTGASLNPDTSSVSGTIGNDDSLAPTPTPTPSPTPTPAPTPEPTPDPNQATSTTPPALSIAALAASNKEGQRGTTPFTFRLSRSGDLSRSSTVQYTVSGSGSRRSRASASDFAGNRFPSGTISFNPGEATATLTIGVRGDRTKEGSERFSVQLVNPSNALLSSSSATGLIRNDDRRRLGGRRRSRQARLVDPSRDQLTGRSHTLALHGNRAERRSSREPLIQQSSLARSETTPTLISPSSTAIAPTEPISLVAPSLVNSSADVPVLGNAAMLSTSALGSRPDTALL